MKKVAVLPTLVTVANGYCGVLAIYKINDGLCYQAAFLILLAMLFDMLDGKVARMAGMSSRFGGQLDSLCDAISFGVAPAFLVKTVVEAEGVWPAVYHPKLLTLLTIAYSIGALVRLARYNVEHAASEGSDKDGKGVPEFSGMPTPGAAGVLAAAVFLALDPKGASFYPAVLPALPVATFLIGALMVSEVPYIHFGSRVLQGRGGFPYVFGVLLFFALLTKFPHEVFFVGFTAYALSGIVLVPIRKLTGGPRKPEPDEDEVRIPDGL